MRQTRFQHRRRSLLALGALGLLSPGTLLSSQRTPTPRQSRGPFYPDEVALDDDADLTWFGDRKARAAGEITDLGGRLLDLNGHSLSGVRIEIWQCDASGYYRHPRDRGGEKVDPNFQGHGHAITDSEGWYRFRTLKPVPYPGRTPHIHMATSAPGERPFVTQMYIAGESRNQDDFLYRSIPVEQRALVEAEFIRSASADADYSAQFDLVIGA